MITSAYNAIGSRVPFAKAIADRAVSRGTEVPSTSLLYDLWLCYDLNIYNFYILISYIIIILHGDPSLYLKVVMSSKQRTRSLINWTRRDKTAALTSSKSANMAEATESLDKSYEASEELIISEFTSDEEDESKSTSEGSDNDGLDEEEEQKISATDNTATDELNEYLKELQVEEEDDNPNINGGKEKEAEMKYEGVRIEERAGSTEATSEKPAKHHLYLSGRILHLVPVPSSENSDDEKRVVLYETPREMYGKLRLSIRMILDHSTKRYLKVLQQLINQLEKEKPHYGA